MEALFKNIANSNVNFVYITEKMDININPERPVIILSINGDNDLPRAKSEMIIKYNGTQFNQETQNWLDEMNYADKIDLEWLNNIHSNVIKIYANSIGKLGPKLNMVPLGRDFKNKNYFDLVDGFNKVDKTILCYYNVTLPPNCLHWYGMLRRHIYNIIVKKNYIKHKKCNIHPRQYSIADILSYYTDLSKCKFMICPRGCGIDTYRLWDCIHMGCIPIVEKYEGYQQFEDLPILFIDSWKQIEYFTEDYLENKWKSMLEQDYDYNKMRMSYWENKILNAK